MKNLEEQTKQILKESHLYANKKLGQNFLINEQIVENIIEHAKVDDSDCIIEIGPGIGTLTEALLKKAGRVVCIEIDSNMIPILEKKFLRNPKFELINKDILKVDLKELIDNQKEMHGFTTIKVVANLPYYITTPILMKLLEEKLQIESITVMVQKEVAQRLAAIPGDEHTGAITHTIYYYTEPSIIMHVPKENFVPIPKVDSAVLQLKILKKPRIEVEDEKFFFELIKTAFSQKRKTLLNVLNNANLIRKENLIEILKELNLSEKIRGEKITIEQFAMLAKLLKNHTVK